MKRSDGFTYVKLLVVVVISGMIVAIMISSLLKSREEAEEANGKQTPRQIKPTSQPQTGNNPYDMPAAKWKRVQQRMKKQQKRRPKQAHFPSVTAPTNPRQQPTLPRPNHKILLTKGRMNDARWKYIQAEMRRQQAARQQIPEIIPPPQTAKAEVTADDFGLDDTEDLLALDVVSPYE